MNRKHVTYSNYYEYQNNIYEINTRKNSGCFTSILKAGIARLNHCLKYYKRIFVYFFGLHSKHEMNNSSHITRFFDRLKLRVRDKYACDLYYLWVREQHKADTQHYHLMIILDGDKIRHPKGLVELLRAVWEGGKNQGMNTINLVEKPYYMIKDQSTLGEAVYRMSYMAKERGKGNRPPQAKDYGASRLV